MTDDVADEEQCQKYENKNQHMLELLEELQDYLNDLQKITGAMGAAMSIVDELWGLMQKRKTGIEQCTEKQMPLQGDYIFYTCIPCEVNNSAFSGERTVRLLINRNIVATVPTDACKDGCVVVAIIGNNGKHFLRVSSSVEQEHFEIDAETSMRIRYPDNGEELREEIRKSTIAKLEAEENVVPNKSERRNGQRDS